jgi:hypothetical protein
MTSNKLFLRVVLLLLMASCPALGATKVFLRSGGSYLKPPTEWTFPAAYGNQGASKNTSVTNSIAGALTGHYWPIATSGYIATVSGTGNKLAYFSWPLSAGVTIEGTITPNIWGLESNAACNCGFRYEVLRWSVAQGGIVSSLGISTDDGVTEWGTSAEVRTAPTLTPTSTAFVTGDRIVIIIYNDDGNGVTEASGYNWTLDTNAATGVDGDTYLNFTEAISFAGTDLNNARVEGGTN